MARTRSLRIIYDLIAWLYAYPADVIRKQGERDPAALAWAIENGAIRHGVIHGPITLDRSPPSPESGGALAVINATLACGLEYPDGFISDRLSHTDAITITYVNGVDQRELQTITAFGCIYRLDAPPHPDTNDPPDGVLFTSGAPYITDPEIAPAGWSLTEPARPYPPGQVLWLRDVTRYGGPGEPLTYDNLGLVP